MTRTRKLLERAVQIAGSQTKLAEKIGLTQQGVSYILRRAHVSAETAVAIERVTEGKIKRAELRPDIFGDAA